MDIVLFLIIGIVAGWLAGVLVKGSGFGLIPDLVIGIVGAIVGGLLFGLLGIGSNGGFVGSIVVATFGAVVLILFVRAIKKK